MQVMGEVRPDGNRALDGRYRQTKNLAGCFAKSHGMLPEKPCPE